MPSPTQSFNQGFATTEYLAASLLDMAWHQLTPDQVPDADGLLAFEEEALRSAGVVLDALLSRGGSADTRTLYRNFRSADPNIAPLLKRRGLG